MWSCRQRSVKATILQSNFWEQNLSFSPTVSLNLTPSPIKLRSLKIKQEQALLMKTGKEASPIILEAWSAHPPSPWSLPFCSSIAYVFFRKEEVDTQKSSLNSFVMTETAIFHSISSFFTIQVFAMSRNGCKTLAASVLIAWNWLKSWTTDPFFWHL